MKKAAFLLILICASCGLRTITLDNGHTKVAVNPQVYHNRDKFSPDILKKIDTTVIYEEYTESYYIGMARVSFKDVARKNPDSPSKIYGAYKFYNNGNFNYFILDDRNELNKEMFNPEFTGLRGVLFKKDNEIHGDLITKVSDIGRIGILNEKLFFKGDTLIVRGKGSTNKYIKRQLPAGFLSYSAKW